MIYNYKVKDTNGEMASLDEYKGKVLLVVNTATGKGTPVRRVLSVTGASSGAGF